MAVIDVAGYVAELKEHAVDHGFHVHDERHFVETYSLRQAWEVDLHPAEGCGRPPGGLAGARPRRRGAALRRARPLPRREPLPARPGPRLARRELTALTPSVLGAKLAAIATDFAPKTIGGLLARAGAVGDDLD